MIDTNLIEENIVPFLCGMGSTLFELLEDLFVQVDDLYKAKLLQLKLIHIFARAIFY